MKIAFDVDGVITEMPELFSVLSQSLMAAGHEVHIVTDYDEHFRAQREKELKNYGIVYTKLVITGKKQEYCQMHGISFLLDDDADYFPSVGYKVINIGNMLGT